MLFVCLMAPPCVLAVCHRMFTHQTEEPRVHRNSSHKTWACLSIYSYKTGEGERMTGRRYSHRHIGTLKKRCGSGGGLQLERRDVRHELFWNLGGNQEGEIFGSGTSGLNILDTPRSFLLLLVLLLLPLFLLSLLPEPKSCVLSFRRMCCVTTKKRAFPEYSSL